MGEILIQGATVLTMEGHDSIINDGEIAIGTDRIISVGKRGSAPENFKAEKVIDGTGMVAMPGFVNCHTHSSMTLLRSYADDLPLMKWLNEKIWPLEEKLQNEDFYWGAKLCCLEMIKSGTTTFADMYFQMEQIARAVAESGIRACLSRGMIGLGPYAEMAVDESIQFIEKWHGAARGRITAMFGPHAAYTCHPEYLSLVAELAATYGVGIHIHVAETADESERVKEEYGTTPVRHLDSLGIFEGPVLAAHCVHIDQEEIEILARKRVAVAHCPESNMKLASGIPPVAGLIKAGAHVALGTDGAASNNNLDMMEEMRTAALLQKVATGDAMVLPAFETLKMATHNGAAALGLAGLGLIQKGMLADIILVDMRRPHLYPRHDLIANLVYAAQSSDVDTVIINGEVVMEGRKVLSMDEDEVMAQAQKCADRLVGKKN
ncbi:amidohydrolase [Pelotomaculum propionicicum]|uniref:amidohydrolase n=1 Tax=Pelotomaculum propionicicum TaxID=258475 RepID=UPI003B7B7445